MNLNWSNSLETPNLGKNRRFLEPCDLEIWRMTFNKANLRDLIAATGLVILLKFDPNHRFFSPCDLEIWCMTSKNNRAPLLYYIKLVHHFKSISELKLKLQSRNAQFGSKSAIFCSVWPWILTDALIKQKGTSSMLLKALCIISQPSVNSNWSYSPETPNLGQIRNFFKAVRPWNLTDELAKQ